MSVNGNISAGGEIRGTVSGPAPIHGSTGGTKVLHTDSYAIAVANGFVGTVDEWLESLKGKDGISPVVAVEDIDGGHRVTITDKDGEKTFDVMDGEDGAVTEEQIASAVEDYMAEHPVECVDAVKTVNGISPDANGNVEIPVSGGNVDLTGYATEQYVKDYAQPKGNYLTEVPSGYATEEFVKNKIAEAELGGEEVDLSGYAQKSELPTKVSQLQNDSGYLTAVPDGYAKTEDIPKNASDIGAQPEGDYALRSEIPSVPVKSVNGKTGTVSLTATDVKARPDSWMPSASDVGALPSSTVIPTVPTKLSAFTNDSGFITGYTETDPTVPSWAKQANKPSYTASEVGALPNTTKIPSKTSDLTNDSGYITGYTETDPTVPAWAKAASKPSYSKSEVGLGNVDNVKQYSASNPPPYPVTSVNGKTGAVTITVPTVPTKVSAFENDKGYLTQHQDISGKLDTSALPTAINTALEQAKASGEFDGEDGQRGTGLLPVTTAPSSYTTAVGGITPKYRMAISTIKTQAGVTEVLLGDTVRYSYYHYPIDYLDASYAYFTERVSIRGSTGAAGKDAVLTMFISPDGNDSNDGLTASTPKKTVASCVTAGVKRISAKRGVYNEIVALSNIGELEILPTDNDLTYAVGVEREPIVFDTSDSIAVSSLAAYNSIKRVAYSNSANTQFSKVFTAKSQTPIYGDGNGSRYNATIWLLSSDEKTVCIKLKPVLTVAECEAEANTFTYVSGYIYINASMTSVEKIVVPTNWDCGIYINGAERFVLKEVEVRFAGSYNIDIRNCAYFDFYKCACKYTSYGSGFHPFNSNGKLTACYATKNYDGYGISGYGHTTYVDCVSEFNFDDGMSHHNATTGTVIGGRYEGNGKGGNVPAYGAKVNIYGGLYKDNASFGIGYLWSTDLEPASGMVQGAVMVDNPIGLTVQKNCDVTAMNCTYQGNTSDKDVKGNLTEYNANYVKTVNGIKPDENGNVKIEVSGGGDTGSSYTNLLPLSVNASNALYVGDNGEKGYRVGYRVSSSGTEKTATSCCCTGYIPVKSGDTIRIKNFTPDLTGYGIVHFFTSLGGTPSNHIYTNTASGGNMATPDADGLLTVTALASGYFRLTAATIDSTTIITVNEEIT